MTHSSTPAFRLVHESTYRGESEYRIHGGPHHGRRVAIRAWSPDYHAKTMADTTLPIHLLAEVERSGAVYAVGAWDVTPDIAREAQRLHLEQFARICHLVPAGTYVASLDVVTIDRLTNAVTRHNLAEYVAAAA